MKDKEIVAEPWENWTRLPNWIGDNLKTIHPIETHILVFITRQNHGWKDQQNTRFSARYVAKKTGLSLPTAHKYIELLRKKGYILRLKSGNEKEAAEYKINWGATVSVKPDLTDALNDIRHPRSTALNNLKETILKKQSLKETKRADSINRHLNVVPAADEKLSSSFEGEEKELEDDFARYAPF